MNRNIEIKARVRNWPALQRKAAALSGHEPTLLLQEDTFFNVSPGRLKLRTVNDSHELIFYRRPDQNGPKESSYTLAPVQDASAMKNLLAELHGIRAVVRKTRWLYLAGQTRIHLDRVESLGDFLELEVVLKETQSAEEGKAIARNIMDQLGIAQEDLVDRAYVDLLPHQAPRFTR
jgi:predicted adenylyl cyclase CyaB